MAYVAVGKKGINQNIFLVSPPNNVCCGYIISTS